jgi:hypothetical protein
MVGKMVRTHTIGDGGLIQTNVECRCHHCDSAAGLRLRPDGLFECRDRQLCDHFVEVRLIPCPDEVEPS